MKILYVINSNTKGGMEKHVEDLVKGMTDLNHKVYVWCKKGDLVDIYKKAGAKVIANDSIKYDIDFNYIKNLKQFLIENEIDLVHAHELKAVVNTLIAAYFAKTKVKVSHTHTPISEWQTKSIAKKISWIFTYIFYSLIVNLFSDSEIALTESRKKVKIGEGINKNKLDVIANSVDVSQFDIKKNVKTKYKNEILEKYNISTDAFIIGTLGRITIEKGTDILIKAFHEFINHPINTNKPFYLLLAGGGNQESYIKDLIYDFDLEDKVIITGVFDEDDKVKLYSAIDMFVFSTLAEGFGIVLIEAMISEIPVICSDLPVLKEVAKENVTYFKVKDYLNLSQKMDEVYKKITDNTYNTQNAKDLILNEYSFKTFIENYNNLYSRLMIK